MNAERFHANKALLYGKTGENQDGEPEYAPPEEISCRFEKAGKLIRTNNGASMLSDAVIYTRASVKADDRIEYRGESYPVLGVVEVCRLNTRDFFQNEAYLSGHDRRSGARSRSTRHGRA